jgi:CheY-like chemotaxis protein
MPVANGDLRPGGLATCLHCYDYFTIVTLKIVSANFGGDSLVRFVPTINQKGFGMAESSAGKLETILVVDDNDMVLMMVVTLLKAAHFVVLQAVDGPDALTVASGYDGTIDLLLSDIQMPGMTGPDLGVALKRTRPDVHVMLMSGLPGGDLLVLNYGWAFIQKPFVPKKLVQMINSVLHSPDRSQGSHGYDTRKEDR